MAAEVENIFKKSSVLSVKARRSGNQLYGQRNHNKKVHREILLQYSKSIAFAVEDEELALAYGNRSALFLHLVEHEKCLIDIDRALKLTSCGGLKSKLKSRKATCVAAMNSSSIRDSSSRQLNLPNFTPSVKIPSASEAVTVKYNEKFGRHMVATRDIKPGEVIVTETAYVCFPIIAKRHLVCSHCLSFAWNGIPCDHCAFAMYCSETCKTDSWNEYHDVECTLFLTATRPLYIEEDYLPYMMAASRLLIKAIKSEGIDAVIYEFSSASRGHCEGFYGWMVDGKLRFRSCINSHGHADNKKLGDSADSVISHIIEVLCCRTSLFHSRESEMDDETISQLEIMVKKLTYIVDDNVFQYQQFDTDHELMNDCRNKCDAKRGIVLAPISSLINHSCNANTGRMFYQKGKIAMFTVTPVKKGEQLFISYGPFWPMEKVVRQIYLVNSFNFTCKCQACEEIWPDVRQEDVYNQWVNFINAMKEFEECFPYSAEVTSLMKESEDWTFDEETLRHAVKLSELMYKHYSDATIASIRSTCYKDYIFKAFQTLYGEKFAIPDHCL